MATWTIPTTRATAYLVTASDWNTDIVENLKYLKDSPTFGGSIAVTTNATVGGVILAAAGSAGSPVYAFSGDTNTGLYSGGADILAIATGGTNRWNISASGYFIAASDNTYDIGASASASRPRNIYAGTSIMNSVTGVGAMSLRANSTTSVELHIRPNSGKDAYIGFTEDTVADRWVMHSKTGSGTLGFASGSSSSHTDRMSLTSGGNLAIGATAKLYLDGTAATGDTYISEYTSNGVRFTVGGVNALYVFATTLEAPVVYSSTTGSAANVYVDSNGWMQRSTSSLRYKRDIKTLDAEHAKHAVMAMRPITYRGKTDKDQRRHVGFGAEEMADIAPLLATYDEGGEAGTPNYVTYDRVTAYLVSVVQQQQAEIDALKSRVN